MSEKIYNVFEEECSNWLTETVNDIVRRKMECMEKDLAKIAEEYDFITGSMETKIKLLEILPGANVVYSPHIECPTMVYVIKKFDIADLTAEPYRVQTETRYQYTDKLKQAYRRGYFDALDGVLLYKSGGEEES